MSAMLRVRVWVSARARTRMRLWLAIFELSAVRVVHVRLHWRVGLRRSGDRGSRAEIDALRRQAGLLLCLLLLL